ncbi:fluoride efflux transporter FluC [Pseudarthrobacter sp. P1]|uniref:fluoride efflux transporter FluC n=1 Tax=Pseudarthrobacter sp. P1 TaxID=3418418 RepID=UPI003CEB455E
MAASSRPGHLQWSSIALVALGGAAGAGAREGLVLLIPAVDSLPLAIATANLVGAFVLGWLYERLLESGPHDPVARRLRLLVGTGFCGGLTTYSSLALGTATLATGTSPWLAAGYALGTVLVGGCATWLGILAGSRRAGGTAPSDPAVSATASAGRGTP